MIRAVVSLMLAALAAAVQGQVLSTRVDITSQPERATVIVDGRDRGLTPITLFDLAPGRHRVKYRLAGHVECDRYIVVEEGRALQHSNVLEPEKGILLVKSDPAGCEILIDGVSSGVTPRLITSLNAKDACRLTLRKAGYRDSTFNIRFDGRKPLVLDESLVLDSGMITVMSDPPGAEVTVNGIVRGKAPVTVTDVPKGRATVKLSLAGFRDEVVPDVMVNAGDRQTISRIMHGLPGTLTLVSLPEGARFYVNDEFRGKSPVVIPGLDAGEYTVRAELEGYGTETRKITVERGSTPREEFRLSNTMGRIEIVTSPPGAQVVFDSRNLGTTRADDADAEFSNVLAVENVMEGDHQLLVRKEGYAERVLHPKVQSSKTTPVRVRLKRVFKPDFEIVTDYGTYRGVLISNTPDYITIEWRLGVQKSFPRADIRKYGFIERTK